MSLSRRSSGTSLTEGMVCRHTCWRLQVERLRASMQAIEQDLERERQLRLEAQEISVRIVAVGRTLGRDKSIMRQVRIVALQVESVTRLDRGCQKEMQVNVLLEGSRWKAELDKYKEALHISTRSADPAPDPERPHQDLGFPRGFDPQDERQWQKESLRRSRSEAEATFRASSNSTSLASTPRGGGSAKKSPRPKNPADDTAHETFWSETRNMPRELSQSPAVTRLPALAPHTLQNPTSAASFALDLGSVAHARGRAEGADGSARSGNKMADASARSGNSEAFSDISGARAQVWAAGAKTRLGVRG
jgi:hypothetical protein